MREKQSMSMPSMVTAHMNCMAGVKSSEVGISMMSAGMRRVISQCRQVFRVMTSLRIVMVREKEGEAPHGAE